MGELFATCQDELHWLGTTAVPNPSLIKPDQDWAFISGCDTPDQSNRGRRESAPQSGRGAVRCLKLKFERQLDRSRSADLIERVESAALAAASEIVVEHHRGLSELG